MKFVNMSLMPYPDLPPDFAEHHRSIWVDIDRTLFDPTVEHHVFNDFIDMLEFSDSLGFDGIGVNEHHASAYGMQASPNLLASILARSTRHAAIMVMGNSVVLYNPPTRVAEELAMIDVISGGRLIAGFPVGTPMDTAFAYGQNPATVRERYYEAIDLIRRAWTADEPFSFNGNYNKLRYVNALPRTIQRPHPPVWIPGGGSVDTWEWCARNELPFLYLSAFGQKVAEANFKSYWASVREAGFDPNPYKAGFVQSICVADSEREARELYREPIEYFYNVSMTVYEGFADPPGYKTPRSVRLGLEGMMERAAREARQRKNPTFFKKGLSFDEIVEKGYIIIGSPTQVTEKLHEVITSLNVGHMLLLLHQGSMDRDLTRYNIKMTAKKVLPELQLVFDNEWENRWWPKPMPASERVLPDPTFGPRGRVVLPEAEAATAV